MTASDLPMKKRQLLTIGALLLAVFTVSAAYGITLPALPDLLNSFSGGKSSVATSTGLLTATYAAALFIFSPVWGALSDRTSRRPILIVGMIGLGATMLVFPILSNQLGLYVQRFASGIFAAAVTPVASAALGELQQSEEARIRQLTLASVANVLGFLVGPLLGAALPSAVSLVYSKHSLVLSPAPSLALALVAMVTAVIFVLFLPAKDFSSGPTSASPKLERSTSIGGLLALSFIVSVAIGGFEVAFVVRGKLDIGLSPLEIALAFTECSLVMLATQAIVLSPWIKPAKTQWLLGPTFVALALGVALLYGASSFRVMMAAIAAIAGSAGILAPILTYWTSTKAGLTQGAELGKQAAMTSLGAAAGSAAGGLTLEYGSWTLSPLLVIAALAIAGAIISVPLARRM